MKRHLPKGPLPKAWPMKTIYLPIRQRKFHCLFNSETGECVRHYPRKKGRTFVLKRRNQLNRIFGRHLFGIR